MECVCDTDDCVVFMCTIEDNQKPPIFHHNGTSQNNHTVNAVGNNSQVFEVSENVESANLDPTSSPEM